MNMFQSIMVFKPPYILTIKHISTSKETLKLSLGFELFYLPINSAITKNARQQNFIFYILRPLSKNMGNMHSSLANQIAHIFTC